MTQVPVVAIVGRPNVGKSTLFNALTRRRDALVADLPGVTRDRIYGRALLAGRPAVIIDTGGLDKAMDRVGQGAQGQTRLAMEEADLLVLVTDARAGVLPADHDIVVELRRLDKPVVHVVNKTDGLDRDVALAEASELGVGEARAISASHRQGLAGLEEALAQALPEAGDHEQTGQTPEVPGLALVGRPNVGKSTLLNRLLGEERALATPVPGTTRDPIHAIVERDGLRLELIDTAGIRRRRGSHQGVERFSTIKSLQAIEQAQLVCVICDGTEGVTDQDARLVGHVIEAGRGLLVVLNKWDGIDEERRRQLLSEVSERLDFARFAPVVVISGLHGSGLGELTDAVEHVQRAGSKSLATGALTRVLRDAVDAHPLPAAAGRAPKLRYAHAGGQFPTRIIIHGNRTSHVGDSYRRYLANRFRAAFDLVGIPVHLVFRDSDNPYAGRRNRLTPRQMQKRRRLRKFDLKRTKRR